MFIKNTDTYERYLAESEQIEDCSAQMLKRPQLGSEYREEMLGNMMMLYVKDLFTGLIARR